MNRKVLTSIIGLTLMACAVGRPGSSVAADPANEASQRAQLYPKISRYLSSAAALEPAFLAP